MNVILSFSMGLLLGMIATWLFELILKTNKKLKNRYYKHHNVFLGYHVHHSIYGLAAILAGIVLFLINEKSSALFYVALGIGIITVHTISDGRFVFFDKQK